MSIERRPKPVTIPVRVPDEIYADVRRWAQIKGKTPGDILSDAWDQWVREHKAEILLELDALREEIASR
jgi:hypothetical protein